MTSTLTRGKTGEPSAFLREIPYEKPRSRLLEVDAARGLAILLVVLGHVVARDMPAGNAWFAEVKAAIYLFHMPLFMVLTGITFALSVPRFAGWGKWRASPASAWSACSCPTSPSAC